MEPEQTLVRVAGRVYRRAAVTRRVVAGGAGAGAHSRSAGGSGAGAAAGGDRGGGSGAGQRVGRYVEPGEEAGSAPDDPSIVPRAGGGGFEARLRIGPDFYAKVLGRKGRTKQDIERDTGASIHVPSRAEQSDPQKQVIVVSGPSARAVGEAKARVELIVDKAMERIPYTHFVCVPLPDVKAHLEKFKQAAVREHPDDAKPHLFVSPAKAHLTLLMLKLPNPPQVEAAAATLDSATAELHALASKHSGSPTVVLRGLACMNDDATEANVVYAQVSKSRTKTLIESMGEIIAKAFLKAGLVTEDDIVQQRLRAGVGNRIKPKLHATVMNSKLANTGRGRREPFDASSIIRAYQERPLGSSPLKELHLSRRGAFGRNGFYKADHVVPLPV